MANEPNGPLNEIDLKRFMAGDICLASRTRRLSRILTRMYEDVLREYGLTVAQFSLLTIIAAHGPVTPAEIGRRQDLEKSTLSRTIGKMIANGWVEDGHDDTGERGLVLTAPGREVLRNAVPAWQSVQNRVTQAFGDPATKTLDEMIAAAHGM